MSRIEEIKQIIIEEGLTLPDRQPYKVYRRFYLTYLLRKENLILREIGEIFNKNHATIIHYLLRHDKLFRTKNKNYLSFTIDLREKVPIKKTLRQEILQVNSMQELTDLKNKIKSCLY
jgi:hypothetical protein